MGSTEGSLQRLQGLIETGGPGYVLGLHAFVEDRIREALAGGSAGFSKLLAAFGAHLEARGSSGDDLRVLARIGAEHAAAREAARSSLPLDTEEARAATHNFLRFCALCGIQSEALDPFRAFRDGWARKVPAVAPGSPLDDARSEIIFAQPDTRSLLAQTHQWTRDRQRLAEVEGELIRIAAALEKERSPELERDRGELQRQKAEIEKKLAGYHDLDLYVRHVRRFSLYTRTRMDYERSVMELTPEQAEAVEALRPGRDFLIRGGAGTGKTIVLLHALRALRRARETELPLRPGQRILFLTYTTTLVKYDRYVAGILRERADDLILTADSFFQSKLAARGRSERVDYAVISRLAAKLNSTGFLTDPELAVELEDFLFGGLVSRREYVEDMIPRRGMKQPLTAAQRAVVWEIREKAAAEMEHDGILSRNFSRVKIIEELEARPEDLSLRDLDVALVDESQDLSAADLRALKLMTQRGLILAGDAGQSIYGVSSPYRRAGVDIVGRSRVLRTSFRNTRPIQELADAYRSLSAREDDEGVGATAFRDGPAPELYTAATRGELARLLLRKAALFIDRLGYDPENITVLAPTRTDIATLADLLGHAGYRHANIRDEEFSFTEEKTIRLSTLHSSKGLDFPVVLLYLPVLPPRGELDDRAAAERVRNLVYVAMTRAMDNLNVFTLEGDHEGQQEEPLQDLVRAMRAQYASGVR